MKTLKTEVNEMENKTNVVEQKEEAGAVVEKIWSYRADSPSVWVGHLGAYGAGYLIGDWISLPADEEEIESLYKWICAEAKKVGEDGEEFYIGDTNNMPFEVGEYTSVTLLSEALEAYELLSDDQILAIETVEEHFQVNTQQAIEMLLNEEVEYRVYYNCDDMGDIAQERLEETGELEEIKQLIEKQYKYSYNPKAGKSLQDLLDFFDYDAYGEKLENNGYFYKVDSKNGIWVEIFN